MSGGHRRFPRAKLCTIAGTKKKLPRWWEFGREVLQKWGEFSVWVGVLLLFGRFRGEFGRVFPLRGMVVPNLHRSPCYAQISLEALALHGSLTLIP